MFKFGAILSAWAGFGYALFIVITHGMFNLAGLIFLVLSPLLGAIAYGLTIGFLIFVVLDALWSMLKRALGCHH